MGTLHAAALGRTTVSDVEGCYIHSPTITEGLKYLFAGLPQTDQV